jgi:Flp pilus assembly protein TadG
MANICEHLARLCRSFKDRTDGNVTVEFVLWVPFFMGLLLMIADVSLVFMRQSNFWNVSSDTARIVARHALEPVEAEAYARSKAAFGAYSPEVEVTVNERASTVTVTIIGQSDEMAPFGVLGLMLGDTISTRVTQTLEPI